MSRSHFGTSWSTLTCVMVIAGSSTHCMRGPPQHRRQTSTSKALADRIDPSSLCVSMHRPCVTWREALPSTYHPLSTSTMTTICLALLAIRGYHRRPRSRPAPAFKTLASGTPSAPLHTSSHISRPYIHRRPAYCITGSIIDTHWPLPHQFPLRQLHLRNRYYPTSHYRIIPSPAAPHHLL